MCARARVRAMSNSLRPHGLLRPAPPPPRLLCPWDSSGKNTAAGCHFLLQGIVPNQGSNPHLLRCWWVLYCRATRKPTLVVQSLGHANSVTPWTTAHQAPLSSAGSRSLLEFMSFESVMLSNHLIFCRPLLLPSIFPSIKVCSNESALHIR